MSDTFLERIVAATRTDLADRKAHVPPEEMLVRATGAPPPRPFFAALRPEPGGSARLIAEIKRASPSKGLLAEEFDPVAQARAYERGGAAAVSVLTEPHYFRGSLDHLTAARAAVTLPVLRKDFILDPYQVYEARAAGADAILLICALPDDAALADLLALARSLGMEALVEAHDAAEAERAVAAGAAVVGVNSRDLRTFAVYTDIVRDLRAHVPPTCVFVAESGIADGLGAARARAWGADAILVGEALMRAADPEAKARELATAPGGLIREFFAVEGHPFVKICGLTTPEQVKLVDELEADAFGLVFAPSRRRVTLDQAQELVDATLYGEGLGAIGVFVNEAAEEIALVADALHLDAVQLSGDETPADCAAVTALARVPVVKALRLRSASDLALLDDYALADATLLLDTPVADGAYGGTGKTGDWDLAREAAGRWPIILSGGLMPENVADAIRVVQPRGVDVSSGVETNGVKDLDKIRAFIRAARGA